MSAQVTVTDDDGPTLMLTLAQAIVSEGTATMATVRRNTGTSGALPVNLGSSAPTEATVPPSVTIPDGAAAVSSPVTSLIDATADGLQPVVVTAAAEGFTAGTATLTVTDTDLPDLVLTTVSGPATAYVGDQPALTFGLANQGVAALTGRVTQRVFLSRDALVGDDLLIGSYDLQPAAPGLAPNSPPIVQTVTSSFALRETGDHWVIVTADVNGDVAELDEQNNTRIAAAPIRVLSDFTATVRVDLADKVQLAGTEIPLVGSITVPAGRPSAGKRVDLHLQLREFKRVIAVITDAGGRFRTVFKPLPGEAGHYTVGAAMGGETTAAPQDEFTLLGARFEPASVAVSVDEASNPGQAHIRDF